MQIYKEVHTHTNYELSRSKNIVQMNVNVEWAKQQKQKHT